MRNILRMKPPLPALPALPAIVGAFVFISSLIAATSCAAENEEVKVDFFVTVPKDTDPASTIYLAGNLPQLGAWQADGVRLLKQDDGTYHAQLLLPRGRTIEYKVTRGSWETVEKGPAGEELDNRTLKLERDATERVSVANWRNDAAAPVGPAGPATRKNTITGDVRAHDVHSKILNNNRRVLVWLPPGYEEDAHRRYPVLYMHDGQNLFDDATSFAGEWRVDETAQQLVEQGKIEPIIIVGIENTWQRVLEYTPTVDAGEGGRGAQYAKFVVEEVKPFIDQTYRTKPDKANTAVGGSSLGGLISIYMIQRHGDVFSRCAAVSPSLWWGDGKYLADMTRDMSFAKGKRIWLDMGTTENADPAMSRENVQHCEAFAESLRGAGLTMDKDFAWHAYEGAKHNESAWAERFDEVLMFLFGK